jgi:hypothetical protein
VHLLEHVRVLASLLVRVFHAQDEAAAEMAGEQRAEERRAYIAEM